MHALADAVTTGAPWSWNPLDDLGELFRYEFMRNAFVAGTAVAIVAGVVGYFAVLRGLAFASHTLSQIGFAGATGALAAGVDPLVGLLVANTAGAGVVGVAGRRERGRDVVVGVVLTFSLGLGLLFLRLSAAHAAVPVLVGDVYGVSAGDVRVSLVLSALLLSAVALAHRPLLFASVDAEVARARGVRVELLSVGFLLVLAGTTSVATPIVGVLLAFALLVGPAAASMALCSRPSSAVVLSVALGVLDIWLALGLAYWIDVPPSVFVTALAFAIYVAARLRPRRSTRDDEDVARR